MYKCIKCDLTFTRKYNLTCHMKNVKCEPSPIIMIDGKPKYCCKLCPYNFTKHIYLKNHIEKDHFTEYMKEKVKNLEEQLAEANKKITNKKVVIIEEQNIETQNNIDTQNNIETQNNIQTQNNNFNINQNIINENSVYVNPIDKSTLGHLSETLVKHCIMDPFKYLPELILAIHFNKDVPENNNIIIKSISRSLYSLFTVNGFKQFSGISGLNEIVQNDYALFEYFVEDIFAKKYNIKAKDLDNFLDDCELLNHYCKDPEDSMKNDEKYKLCIRKLKQVLCNPELRSIKDRYLNKKYIDKNNVEHEMVYDDNLHKKYHSFITQKNKQASIITL
jgi:hypothetical protein